MASAQRLRSLLQKSTNRRQPVNDGVAPGSVRKVLPGKSTFSELPKAGLPSFSPTCQNTDSVPTVTPQLNDDVLGDSRCRLDSLVGVVVQRVGNRVAVHIIIWRQLRFDVRH